MGVDNEVVAFNTTQMPKERFLSGVEEKTIEDGYGSFTSISLGSIYWQDWQAFNNNYYICGAQAKVEFSDWVLDDTGVTKINWKEAVGALTAILRLGIDRIRGVPVRRQSETTNQ